MKKLLFFILVIVVIGVVAAIVLSTPSIDSKPKSPEPSVEKPKVSTKETKEPPKPVKVEPVPVPKKTKTTSELIEETVVNKKKTTPNPKTVSPERYLTNSDNVRMRAQPRLDAPIMGSLKIGSRVIVINKNISGDPVENYKKTAWCQIKVWTGAKFETGYIYGAFISVQRSDQLTTRAITAETKEITKIREGASGTFETLATIPPNTKVLVLGRTRDMKYLTGYGYDYWFKIDHGKGSGWVFGDYLEWDTFSKEGVPVLNPRIK